MDLRQSNVEFRSVQARDHIKKKNLPFFAIYLTGMRRSTSSARTLCLA